MRGSRVTKKCRKFSNLSGNGQRGEEKRKKGNKEREKKKRRIESGLNEKPFTDPFRIFTKADYSYLTKFTYRLNKFPPRSPSFQFVDINCIHFPLLSFLYESSPLLSKLKNYNYSSLNLSEKSLSFFFSNLAERSADKHPAHVCILPALIYAR